MGHSLESFGPFWKFWGTKILVSIAFLQSIAVSVLPPFSMWSEIRQNLFYSSLLCLQCFFVSVFHAFAWPASESWYFCEDTNSVGHNSSLAIKTTSSGNEYNGVRTTHVVET